MKATNKFYKKIFILRHYKYLKQLKYNFEKIYKINHKKKYNDKKLRK